MEINLYNQKGELAGKTKVPEKIFEVSMSPDLVYQTILSQRANRRKKIAKTKDRSEVRGGGRKPWRQKGTGRARHGSIRSPIWRGGGITFGPTGKEVFKKIIPKKMRRKAMFMVLSVKAKEKLIFILEKLEIEKMKTKLIKKLLDKLFLKKGSGLIVLSEIDENIIKACRNIPKIKTIQAQDLNALDLLSYKYVVMSKESVKVIEKTFLS